jgi:hypothetical protein
MKRISEPGAFATNERGKRYAKDDLEDVVAAVTGAPGRQ